MKKKLLAALLVLVMLLSVMPLAAYAEDGDSGEASTIAEGSTDVPEDETANSGEGTGTGSSESVNTTDTSSTGDSTSDTGTTNNNSSINNDTSTDTSGSTDTNAQGTVEGEDGSNAEAGTDVNADTEMADTNNDATEDGTTEESTGEATSDYCPKNTDPNYSGHSWYIDKTVINSDGTHTLTCFYCEYTVTEGHSMYTDDAGNSYCTYCHYGCDHSETKAETGSPLIHYIMCDICGEFMGYEYHTFENGVCTVCGEEECTHENTSWWYTQYGHVHQCGDCGQNIGEWEDHTMVDGTCTVCGYHPCADGEHVYNREAFSSDRHFCTICNYREDCIDEDPVDCVCDICGSPRHGLNGYTVEHDENECWYVCSKCGEVYYRGEHFDDWNNETGAEGSDGLCDVCGYAMNGSSSSADDSGLDDVPKTGDASLALAGLSVLFAACPILKKFVI